MWLRHGVGPETARGGLHLSATRNDDTHVAFPVPVFQCAEVKQRWAELSKTSYVSPHKRYLWMQYADPMA